MILYRIFLTTLAAAVLMVATAHATVSFDFQLGSVPLPPRAVGVLVVDTAGDGFTSPDSAAGTPLQAGETLAGSDDVIVAVFPIRNLAEWGPETGFASFVGPLDYEALGVAEGQSFIFYAFPSRAKGTLLRRGEPFLSFRTEDNASLVGDMGFVLPPEGGTYQLGALANEQGGYTDLASMEVEVSLPLVDDIEDWLVGRDISLQLDGTNDPSRFIVRGLPPGLRYDPTTGLITGRLRRAGDFNLRVWVRNAFGVQGPLNVPLSIAPFPEEATGLFDGLVDRDPSVNDALGGRLTIGVTRLGVLAGRLMLGGERYAVRGALESNMTNGVEENPTTQLTVRRRGQDPLQVDLELDLATGTFSGSVSDGSATASAAGFKDTHHARRDPADMRAGYYTAATDLDPAQGLEGDASIPQGNGFQLVSVRKSGRTLWQGRLADGSPASFASFLGPDGELLYYSPEYRGRGSILGTGQIDPDNGNALTASLDWVKQPFERTRSYPDGFGDPEPVSQLLAGGPYEAPGRNEVVLGLPAEPGNATLAFAEGGIGEAAISPDTELTLTTNNRAITPRNLAENPARVRAGLNARRGWFRGSFLLQDDHPANGTTLRRRAGFEGVLLPDQQLGAGYFELPQLPDPAATPPTTLRNSPILSGQVILEKNTPAD